MIYGDGGQCRDFIYVADVAQACLLAASIPQAAGIACNVGCGQWITINDLWQMVAALAGVETGPRYKPARAGDIRQSYADMDLAMELLNFQPSWSFEKGLRATLDWYRQSVQAGNR